MDNQLYISRLNPVTFYEVDPVALPQYTSRHMDDYWFSEQIRGWQTPVSFKQKWTVDDAVKLQFSSTFGPIQVQLIDCAQNVIIDQNAVLRKKNRRAEGFNIYEVAVSLDSVPPGVYYFLLTFGGKKMISEPQQVYDTLPESLLVEYRNSKFHGDILFETGITFSIRLEAILHSFTPGNSRTAYRDQVFNPSVLKSIPFRTWELIVGKDGGIPDYQGDTLNWILSCDTVMFDGKSYAVADDGEFEIEEFDSVYPMRQYTIKVQEGVNRASKVVGVDVDTNKRIVMSLVLDSTVFGDVSEQAGSNLIVITDVE